jgi:phosphoribosyl-AMP cyclohydrolase
MIVPFFTDLESQSVGHSVDLDEVLENVSFNEDGLIPVIAQQHDTGEVLMMAWMNRESIVETLETGQVCYWSRSRQEFWRKGETSGNRQRLVEMRLDCDGDTALCLVDQTGPACHTGRKNCFYFTLKDGKAIINNDD